MIFQEPVQAAIWHCLNHYDYSGAIFLSERLYAEVKSDESLYLLATAYYRSGQKSQAYLTLKDRYDLSTQCQLLYAICSFDLEKYAESESAILDKDEGCTRTLEEVITDFGDQAAFALLLLGKIGARTERKPQAIEAWKKALKINPFLFSAFEMLCKIGERPNPNTIFQTENIENISVCHGHSINNIESVIITRATPSGNQIIDGTDLEAFITPPPAVLNSFNSSVKPKHKDFKKDLLGTGSLIERDVCTPEDSSLASPLWMSGLKVLPSTRQKQIKRINCDFTRHESPSFGQLLFEASTEEYNGTPNYSQPTYTPSSNHQFLSSRLRAQIDFSNRNNKDSILQNCSQSSNVPVSKTPTSPLTMQPSQNVRRSSRLFSSYSVKEEENKSPTRNKFATPKSPSRKTKQRLVKNSNNNSNHNELGTKKKSIEKEKSETITSDTKNEKSAINQSSNNESGLQQAIQLQKTSMDGIMTLLRNIGEAYVALSSYDCQKAIESLQALSENQYHTSWVYSLMGLAYFEMGDYESSIKYFQMVHSQDPYRMEFMDIYSTALWHLQKEVALSALAQDLINTNKHHPVTWFVNGNCFSMHKEHDTAIKFFQRAVQVDPTFHYAYTLLGHEYITTEELDKAMSCFWNAVRINPMHYNAWFGIGTIYSKQERFNLAERYYTRALSINPQSCIILCHIGMVQHALNQTDKALASFNKAIAMNPKAPLCKFHRASLYFALGRFAEALKEADELKKIVPKESSVYYLIGKVHKKLGQTDLALQYFSWATDLDPKGASSQIKEAFDPSMGRYQTDVVESPQSLTPDEYHSESNSGNPGESMNFDGLPDDSEDSSFN